MQQVPTGKSATALQANTKPQKSKLVCINVNCKRTGHTIKNCYWRGGGKEGQFPEHFRNRQNALATISGTSATPITPISQQNTTPLANLATTPTITYALAACSYLPKDTQDMSPKAKEFIDPIITYTSSIEPNTQPSQTQEQVIIAL